MTHTLRVQGSLTTVTPFHMAHANVSGYIDDNGEPKVLRMEKAMIPCVMTYKVPVRVQQEEGKLMQRVQIPTIPATSLRGRIRRAAADRIKEHWVANNQKIDRQAYHVLQVLSFGSQSIDKNKGVRPEDLTRSENDLYAGVFGGGPHLFPSRLVTVDSYAVTAETLALGILGPEAEHLGAIAAPPAWQTTFGHPYVRRDDLLDFTDPLAPRVIENFETAFAEWQEADLKNRADRKTQRNNAKDAKTNKKTAAAPLSAEVAQANQAGATAADGKSETVKKTGLIGQQAVEAVMPGVSFGFEVSVTGSKAQCGMILVAIRDMLQPGRALGGFVRNGYGRFAANLNVRIDGNLTPFLRSDGRDLLEIADAPAKEFMAAFEEDLKGYSTNHFRNAYLLLDSEESQA